MTRPTLEAIARDISTRAVKERRVDPTAGYPPERLPLQLLVEIVKNDARRVATLATRCSGS